MGLGVSGRGSPLIGQDCLVGFNFIGAERDQAFLLPPDM